MFTKCTSCFKLLSFKLTGRLIPKWHTHLRTYCTARAQKQPWCQMFLDNIDLITDHSIPRQIQHQVKSTNIASQIVKIISNHYNQQSNLFRFCIQLFGSYLKLKYSQTINPSKNTLNRIAKEHQDFIQLIIDLFVLYYHLEDREIVGEETFYRSTLPFLATHLVFQNQDIQMTVTRTAKLALKLHIDKFNIQMQRFGQHTIDQFSVRQELQLNQTTLAVNGSKRYITEETSYSGAVQIIKQIIRVNSPAQKIKLMEGLQKQIQSSVFGFYKKHNIKTINIQINPSDLKSILIYALVQANQPSFYAHLQIGQLFFISQSKTHPIIQILNSSCQNLQSGLIAKKQVISKLTQMTDRPRKGSDSLNFFDQVTSSLDL